MSLWNADMVAGASAAALSYAAATNSGADDETDRAERLRRYLVEVLRAYSASYPELLRRHFPAELDADQIANLWHTIFREMDSFSTGSFHWCPATGSEEINAHQVVFRLLIAVCEFGPLTVALLDHPRWMESQNTLRVVKLCLMPMEDAKWDVLANRIKLERAAAVKRCAPPSPPPPLELPKRYRDALASFNYALGRDVSGKSLKEIWQWLRDDGAEGDYQVPDSFETWAAYIRGAKSAMSGNSNNPRSGRSGRSIAKG